MLDKMRKWGRSMVTKALFVLLIVVFAFWGIGSGFFTTVRPVATVNGQRIGATDLDREAQRLRKNLQQVYGANAAQILQNVNLRQEALDQIVENRLVSDEARHLGIHISDAALQAQIASQPAFQADGHFDFEQYQAVLNSNDMMPADYEAATRASMLENAVRQMVDEGVQVSAAEARHAFDLRDQKITLAYIQVPYQDFTAKISPTAQQVEDFYKSHTERFREPERVKITYVHYDPMLLAGKINPTDKDIEDYYKRNTKSRFTHSEQVHARHILIEVPSGATQAEKDKAKAKAEDILNQLKKGADFAKLAKLYSQDPGTRLEGGDLPTFGRGQMIKPFEEAAFSMKPGELRVVETKFGYHVVRLDSATPAHTDTLAEARPKIIELLRGEAGGKIARDAMDQDVSAALAGTSLRDIATKRGIEVVQTPAFSKEDAMSVVQDPKLVEAAFKLDPGQVRAVIGGSAPYLVKLISRDPSRIPPLKEIEPKVREAYIRVTAESQARARAQELLGKIKRAEDFDKVAAENKLAVRKTDTFARSSNSIPGVGSFPEVTDAAGVVPQIPGVIARVMENQGDSFIFEVLSRTSPTDEDWKSVEKDFSDEFLQQRRAEAWTRFVDSLKSRAKITVDTNQVGEESGEPSS